MTNWIHRINESAGIEEGAAGRASTLPGSISSGGEHREETKKRGLFSLGKKK